MPKKPPTLNYNQAPLARKGQHAPDEFRGDEEARKRWFQLLDEWPWLVQADRSHLVRLIQIEADLQRIYETRDEVDTARYKLLVDEKKLLLSLLYTPYREAVRQDQIERAKTKREQNVIDLFRAKA